MTDRINEIASPKEGDHVNQAGGPRATKQSETQCNDEQVQHDDKVIGSRSTSTQTQIAKLIALLRLGPKTTHSLRMHGISHPAGRIKDLRDSDYLINKETVKAIDSDGFTHINVARYALIKEPAKAPVADAGVRQ